jgi:hypothetical protein
VGVLFNFLDGRLDSVGDRVSGDRCAEGGGVRVVVRFSFVIVDAMWVCFCFRAGFLFVDCIWACLWFGPYPVICCVVRGQFTSRILVLYIHVMV